MSTQVKLDDLLVQVKHPLVGQKDLSIWGGTCSESTLLDFMGHWPLAQMPHRIWEYTDRIEFEQDEQDKQDKTPSPNEILLLERGRLFGEDGDLELRRDGDLFRWRFIGKDGIAPPKGYDAQDFWETHDGVTFHCYQETALLWGERDGSHWHDDRVAGADLRYPVGDDGAPERVQVEYKVYSRAGRVQFVWLTKLSEWKEENDGKGND